MTNFKGYLECFFWDFKRMDNVDHNFTIIQHILNTNSLMVFKPVIVLTASIIECILYDFLTRIQEHSREKIVNLSTNEIALIKNKELPNAFYNYIQLYKKHSIFNNCEGLYAKMEKICEMRNRIHIQNLKQQPPVKEYEIWNKKNAIETGEVLRCIVLYLAKNHPRPDHFHDAPDISEDKFPFPWDNLK